MECKSLEYVARTRVRSETTPAKSPRCGIILATKLICPPTDPCSTPFTEILSSGQSYPTHALYHNESITDYVLSEESKRALRAAGEKYPKWCFKPCQHEKSSLIYTGLMSDSSIASKKTLKNRYTCAAGLYWHHCEKAIRGALNAPRDYIPFASPNDYIISLYPNFGITHTVQPHELSRALTSIKPSFERMARDYRMSLPNFLIELREMKDVLKTLRSRYVNLLISASEYFLLSEFGVKPFLDDVETLSKDVDSFIARRIMAWNDLARKGEVVSFHETIFDYSESGFVHKMAPIAVPGGTGKYYLTVDYTSVAKLHLYVKPRVMELDQALLDKARNRVRGVDNLAKVAWEATPFSFIADWFLDIGELFEQDALELAYDIVDAGYSIKNGIKTTFGGEQSYSSMDHDLGIRQIPNLVDERFSYSRVKLDTTMFLDHTILDDNTQWTVNELNPHQRLLSGALIVTLLKK